MGKPTADDNMGGRNNVIMVEKEQEEGDKQGNLLYFSDSMLMKSNGHLLLRRVEVVNC